MNRMKYEELRSEVNKTAPIQSVFILLILSILSKYSSYFEDTIPI